jgi:flavin-binding protein dodecin
MGEDHVYKKIELVGSSTDSVDSAIKNAITRAAQSVRQLDWFEVDQIRGHIQDGKVARFQVVLKAGFRLD